MNRSNIIVYAFKNTDLRCQHKGLATLALIKKVNINALKPGEHCLFVNNARNKLKLYSANGVLSYVKQDKGRITPATLDAIAVAFQSSTGFRLKPSQRRDLLEKLE